MTEHVSRHHDSGSMKKANEEKTPDTSGKLKIYACHLCPYETEEDKKLEEHEAEIHSELSCPKYKYSTEDK